MFHGYYGFDWSYMTLVVPALLLALWAQFKVKSTYAKYSAVQARQGLTGADAARKILDSNGLQQVRIEHIAGQLTDHYDPKTQVVRLSDAVYGNASIAAIGVAAHEVGHAVQHATGYGFLKLRHAIIPISQAGSTLSMPLILLGLVFNSGPLALAGILLFSLVAVFQLVTLPVEFNASSRALATLDSYGMLDAQELAGTRRVLSAAAMTYVAALAVSLAQLFRLLLLFGRRNNDRD
ncbi:MAG: zinc metallopeptidase [Angelakisella sp.]